LFEINGLSYGSMFYILIKQFTKYNNFHSSFKIYLSLNSSNWFFKSISRAKYFMDIMNGKQMSVIEQVNSRTLKKQKLIVKN